MTGRVLPFLVCILLVWSADCAETNTITPAKAILDIPIGGSIEVRLNQGPRLRGRLEAIRNTEFTMTVPSKQGLETKLIAFSDVKSLKQRKPVRASTVALATLAGLGVCALVFTILLAVAGYD